MAQVDRFGFFNRNTDGVKIYKIGDFSKVVTDEKSIYEYSKSENSLTLSKSIRGIDCLIEFAKNVSSIKIIDKNFLDKKREYNADKGIDITLEVVLEDVSLENGFMIFPNIKKLKFFKEKTIEQKIYNYISVYIE